TFASEVREVLAADEKSQLNAFQQKFVHGPTTYTAYLKRLNDDFRHCPNCQLEFSSQTHCKRREFSRSLNTPAAPPFPAFGERVLCLAVSFPRSTALISIPRILAYLLLSASLSSAAQSFIFGSPNTREHMSDEAAIAARDSFEQRNFLAVARYLAGRLC